MRPERPINKEFPCSLFGLFGLFSLFVFSLHAGPLVDIGDIVPKIQVDIRYATRDNFLGEILYSVNRCLLHEEAAQALARVQRSLEKDGLGLKVWDCYRPLAIQERLWAKAPDDRYVADPKKGSRHNRGAAVDLTLTDNQGREQEMPTPYDDFTEKAHRNFAGVTAGAKENRERLDAAMKVGGFIGLDTEWWHFDYDGWGRYQLMDIPLEPIVALAQSRQLVIVVTPDWSSNQGRLYLVERRLKGFGKIANWPVVVGRAGLAWGLGLHPEIHAEPQKREGDGKSPAGVFSLGKVYGYAQDGLGGLKFPYQVSSPTLRCVDDSKSAFYNKIVEETPNKDWTSAEMMRRDDDLYRWITLINNNQEGAAGRGSCIFFHLWKDEKSGTAGCTAMAQKNMEKLLRWLDPAKHPALVEMPSGVYDDVVKIWNLPLLP